MAPDAIVFALANPRPEIDLEEIEDCVAILASGRSDYPNQINNLLAFPGVFRGALDARATSITPEMKIAAAHALAESIPADELSVDYIVPSVFDRTVAQAVAKAVAAAAHSGAVSGRPRPRSGSRGFPAPPAAESRCARAAPPERLSSTNVGGEPDDQVLVASASKHGATDEIAPAIGDVLLAHGLSVDVKSMEDVDTAFPYEAYVLGSAVYMGSWLRTAKRFLDLHAELIRRGQRGSSAAARSATRRMTPRSEFDAPDLVDRDGCPRPPVVRWPSRQGAPRPERACARGLAAGAGRRRPRVGCGRRLGDRDRALPHSRSARLVFETSR